LRIHLPLVVFAPDEPAERAHILVEFVHEHGFSQRSAGAAISAPYGH
jgi:hypothetical protein